MGSASTFLVSADSNWGTLIDRVSKVTLGRLEIQTLIAGFSRRYPLVGKRRRAGVVFGIRNEAGRESCFQSHHSACNRQCRGHGQKQPSGERAQALGFQVVGQRQAAEGFGVRSTQLRSPETDQPDRAAAAPVHQLHYRQWHNAKQPGVERGAVRSAE